MTEITAYLIVQIVTQMYTVTVSRLVALKTFLTTHILCIHTVQFLPNYLRRDYCIDTYISINLCCFIGSICRSDIAAKWSAIVILGLSFTPSLGNIATFTKTLPSKPHCSTLYTQRSLPSSLLVVMYY
jgi:multisubunit Na+/H+ antiporter MnhF subunit